LLLGDDNLVEVVLGDKTGVAWWQWAANREVDKRLTKRFFEGDVRKEKE
jgi:hypothetical protein